MRQRVDEKTKELILALRAQGLTLRAIGKRVGLSHRAVGYWCDPRIKQRHMETERRYRADPEKAHRHKLMRITREIAKAKGLPVEKVRRQWGLL